MSKLYIVAGPNGAGKTTFAKEFLPTKERIKQRVKQGGHHVPDVDVQRRLNRSLKNFFDLYMPLADAWDVFNKSLYQSWIKLGGKP